MAKMSLYRNFPSKDALIAAYLERANRQLLGWIDELAAPQPRGSEGEARGAIFDGGGRAGLEPGNAWGARSSGPRGPSSPRRTIPVTGWRAEHKRAVAGRFRELADEAGARDPDGLAEELLLVMDGAWSAARVFGPGSHGAEGGSGREDAHRRPDRGWSSLHPKRSGDRTAEGP